MPPVLQKTIREIHQRLRALETREYAEVVGPGSVINAQYLTLALHAVLTAERRFVAGDGLVGTDAGANADYMLDVDLVAAWSGLEFVGGELRVDEDANFTWTGTHTFNANILMGGGITIDGMDPSAFLVTYAAHDHSAGDPTQVDHADLVNVLANQHHAEVHIVNSTGPHAEAGLTIGHVLRVSGAAAFAFAALQAGDIPGLGGVPALTLGLVNAAGAAATYIQTDASVAIFDAVVPGTIQCDDAANTGAAAFAARRDHQHAIVCDVPVDIANANAEGILTYFSRSDHIHNHPAALGANLHHTQIHDVVGADHTLAGAQWNLVGATAINTIGLLLPLSDVSAPAEAILKSDAAGALTLVDLSLTNDLLLADGAVVGITGNEIITWDAAAGTIVVTGASFGVGGYSEGTLHVHTATAGAVAADAGADDLVIENSTDGGITILVPDANDAQIYFGSPNDAIGALIRWENNDDLMTIGTAHAGASLRFVYDNIVEGMRIATGTGHIGIAISPSFRLDVLANAAASYAANFFNDGDNANRYGLRVQCGADDASGVTYYLTGADGNGGYVGAILNNNGVFEIDDGCDERLKKNIRPTASVLDRFRQIEVLDMTIRRNDKRRRGFISQRMQPLFPETTAYMTDEDRYAMFRTAMIPINSKAIQEVDALLTSYTVNADAEREALREQIGIMQNRLAVLEQAA